MSGLFGMFRRSSPEDPTVPLTNENLLDWTGGAPTETGIPVTEKNSLTMPAVWRAVSMISSVSASLPLRTYANGSLERAKSPLLDDPHPELTPYDLWRLTYVHRALWGNAYVQKLRNGAGQVRELWPISPDRVQVARVTVGNQTGKLFHVYDDGGEYQVLTSNEIMHIPGLGYDGVTGVSPVRAAREGIGLSLAAERSSGKFFGQGAMLSGVLQTEQRLTKEQADALKQQWRAKHQGLDSAHDVAVLDSGASFNPITMPYKDAQFLESRRFQVIELGRIFGVPPFLMMDTERSTSWGTGLEQQSIGFVTYDLSPTWLTPTEQRITKELLAEKRQYAAYDVEGLLRGDARSRAEFYRVMREVGALSANDIRKKENMPPVDGGDTYLEPLNMVPLGSERDQEPSGEDDDTDPDADDN